MTNTKLDEWYPMSKNNVGWSYSSGQMCSFISPHVNSPSILLCVENMSLFFFFFFYRVSCPFFSTIPRVNWCMYFQHGIILLTNFRQNECNLSKGLFATLTIRITLDEIWRTRSNIRHTSIAEPRQHYQTRIEFGEGMYIHMPFVI